MGAPIVSQIYNPVSGVFGTGQMRIFGSGGSGSWIVPAGVNRVRARCFGAGAGGGAAAAVLP